MPVCGLSQLHHAHRIRMIPAERTLSLSGSNVTCAFDHALHVASSVAGAAAVRGERLRQHRCFRRHWRFIRQSLRTQHHPVAPGQPLVKMHGDLLTYWMACTTVSTSPGCIRTRKPAIAGRAPATSGWRSGVNSTGLNGRNSSHSAYSAAGVTMTVGQTSGNSSSPGNACLPPPACCPCKPACRKPACPMGRDTGKRRKPPLPAGRACKPHGWAVSCANADITAATCLQAGGDHCSSRLTASGHGIVLREVSTNCTPRWRPNWIRTGNVHCGHLTPDRQHCHSADWKTSRVGNRHSSGL